MGRGLKIGYKFDNSKQMGDTIHNSISNKLDKDALFHLLKSSSSLSTLWDELLQKIQNCLKDENDDAIVRILVPDINLFMPMMM